MRQSRLIIISFNNWQENEGSAINNRKISDFQHVDTPASPVQLFPGKFSGGKSHRDVTGLSVIPPRAERLQQSMQRRLFNPEATDFEMQVHPRPCRCFDSQQDLTPRVGNTALREGWGGGGGRGGRRWEEEVRGNVPSFFSAWKGR